MAFAREVADRVIFMDDGVVVEQGPPGDVIGNPQHERTRTFLQRVLDPIHVETVDQREVTGFTPPDTAPSPRRRRGASGPAVGGRG